MYLSRPGAKPIVKSSLYSNKQDYSSMIYIFIALYQEVLIPKRTRKKILSSIHLHISHYLSKIQGYYFFSSSTVIKHSCILLQQQFKHYWLSIWECITLNSDNHSSTTPVSTANIFQHPFQNLQPERISKPSLWKLCSHCIKQMMKIKSLWIFKEFYHAFTC